jgi:23S rRNA pseudouridine1911/1915/1917 synthase
MITPEELRAWILFEDDALLVMNKHAHVLCHRSKHGPWSSLVSAAREYLGVERLHMPTRLDRETSGVVVLLKESRLAALLQRGMEEGRIHKTYLAILSGEMREPLRAEQPIGKHPNSRVLVRRGVVESGRMAATEFEPLSTGGGFTLARVRPLSGRMHQIRVHAQWLGFPVAGDKLYGPDERLFLEFREEGWTQRHEALLGIERQALHAQEWRFEDSEMPLYFTAPLPEDWAPLMRRAGLVYSGFK